MDGDAGGWPVRRSMNHDSVPRNYPGDPGFDGRARPRLADATNGGGLFGLRM